MSLTRWRLELAYAYRNSEGLGSLTGNPYWEVYEHYNAVMMFDSEEVAREVYKEAKDIAGWEAGWGEKDEESENPPDNAINFAAKHNVMMFDDEGHLLNWPLALLDIIRFQKVEELEDE